MRFHDVFQGVSILAFTVAAFASFPAYANVVEADDANYDDQVIIVTGASQGYGTDEAVSTKTDTPLIDVPQTINVITREQLDDQAQHSMGDVLRYVPGVTVGQGEGNRDQITLRGQNTTADFFLDGVRDDVQYYRGLYNLERIEVLKGPSALIFGRGGGGGVINRVQKTPDAATSFAAGRASVNSFGAYDVSADLNAPINDKIAVRLNANYESLNNHRDYYEGERYAWNPYISFALSDDWKLGLSYEYVKDDRVLDRGIPSVSNGLNAPATPLKGYRDQFFGVPGVNKSVLEAQIAKLRLDGKLAENLSFSSTLLYGDYDKIYTNVYANGALNPVTNSVPLAGYSDPTTRKNYLAQANLLWDISTGAIKHKILLGAEYGDQKSANQRRDAVLSLSSLNLSTPVFPVATFPVVNRDTVSDVEFFSVYAQDQISLGEHVEIVAGLRFDSFDIQGTDFVPVVDQPFARKDEKISPRFGLILKPQENISLYGSYSRSFQPRSGNQFLTLTSITQNLAPEKFTNYEVGVKWDIQEHLNVTAALFQLDRTNATTPDPANPALSINVGATRVKGAELSVSGHITPQWQVNGGYAYQDAHLRGNDTVRLAQVPKHQFSLWNRYNFSDAFGAGIGIIHQSSQFAAIRTLPTITRLPSLTRVDAAVFYDLNEKVKLQLNVENLFDTEYFSDAHNNNNISTGAPINARLSVAVKF
jgi:catecholate siderophore receptor